MRSRAIIRAAMLSGTIAVGVTPVAAQTPITNGGFEAPTVSAGQYLALEPGYSGLTGWVIDTSNVVVIDKTYAEDNLVFNPHSGDSAIDLTGEGLKPGAIHVDVPTVPGTTYRLSFWVGNAATNGYNSAYYTRSAIVAVYVDGTFMGRYENGTTSLNAINWRCFSASFSGNGQTRQVRFAHENVGENYAGLDDVTITSGPSLGTTYGYDALGRLTSVAEPSPNQPAYAATYSFDKAGNRSGVSTSVSGC